ncbi:MAG: hypothetical protein KIT22_14625, partial [Verrucomicrobiae bacterium]|nr:hypothetical protein [Verrucomicrobiae bacterium]
PSAVPNRTKFRIKTLTVAELMQRTGGVAPEGAAVAGSSMELELEGDALRAPVRLKFPVNLARLGFPTNEVATNAAMALAIVRDTQDVTSFEVVDQLAFTPNSTAGGALGGRSRPAIGRFQGGSLDDEDLVGVAESVIGFTPEGFIADAVFRFVVLPILVGPRAVVIKGKVYSIPVELNEALDAAQLAAGFDPTGLASVALTAAQKAVARPLGGAYVVLNQVINPVTGPPGRLRPGMVYSTSSGNGDFLMVAPSLMDIYRVTVMHPSYQEKLSEIVYPLAQLSLAGVVFRNFYFQYPVLVQTPPTFSISHSPQWPAPGQTTEVRIVASQAVVAPEIGARVFGVSSLVAGVPATVGDAVLTNIVETTSGTTRRWTGELRADKAVQVTLRAVIQSQNGVGDSLPVIPYVVNFSGEPPAPTNSVIPRPDTNDVHGPIVVTTVPAENGYVDTSGALILVFNKPIDRAVTDQLDGISLGGGPEGALQPQVDLSPDQKVLTLHFQGLEPDEPYTLTVSGVSVRDLAGQSLDQRPSTPDPDSFTLHFRTMPAPEGPLSGLSNGRGSVISGQWLYVADQSSQGNFLRVYSLRDPAAPALLNSVRLFGPPRDLILIPKYSFRLDRNGPVETADLLVIVGGDLDAVIGGDASVTVRGQYLWVLDVSDPLTPKILAQPIVTYRVGSAVTKVRWSPPYLVYQEFGADIQALGFVNLQEMIIGYGLPSSIVSQAGRVGADLNGDGDYVDADEVVPIPETPAAEFYGKKQSYVLPRTSQKILDFSVTRGGRAVGVTLKDGFKLDRDGRPTGPRLLPSYRSLVFNGFPLDLEGPTNASVFFRTGSYPRWVTLFDSLEVVTNGVSAVFSAALVSLSPDADGLQKLALLDLSFADNPRLVNSFAIPDQLLGGAIQSLTQLPDGTLELSGTRNRLILDPRQLGEPTVPEGRVHPSILAVIPAAGGGTRSLGYSDYGVHAVADSGRGVVVQVAPRMEFVS